MPSTMSGSTMTTSPNNSGLLTTRAAQTAAEGRDYTTLYTVDPHGKSGARVGVLAIRDDGSAVITNNPPGPSVELIAQSQVGIQTGQSRKWFPTQNGSRLREVSDAAIHGRSIVWVEETQNMRPSTDLKVFAMRAGQHQPTLLSDSSDLAKSGRGWGARIMVRDLAGHEPVTTAVDKAKNPAATEGGIAYVLSNDVDPSMSANRYEIRLRHAGADTLITSGPLAKDEQVSAMCASDTLLAWAVRSPFPPRENPAALTGGHLHVMTLATKTQQTIELDDSAAGLSLGCGDTFIAWGNGSGNGDPGQYVLDVSSSKIWKLGENSGISVVLAAGGMLAWALPPRSAQEAAPWRITKWHGV